MTNHSSVGRHPLAMWIFCVVGCFALGLWVGCGPANNTIVVETDEYTYDAVAAQIAAEEAATSADDE